jgi:hypothetical protein
MHAKPASFLGLIGTFRHKDTSLLRRIIGVPKYCVKELTVESVFEFTHFSLIYVGTRRTHKCQAIISCPEIVISFQA